MTRGRPAAAVLAAMAMALTLAAPATSAPVIGSTPATPVAPVDLLLLDSEVRAALGSVHDGNTALCGARFDLVLGFTHGPEFDRLPVATRRMVLTRALACSQGERALPALALIRRLEGLATSPREIADANQLLLRDARARDDAPDAARRLIAIIDADPGRVAEWWPPYISPIVQDVAEDDVLSTALLKRLTSLAWTDADSRDAARNGWAQMYAARLLKAGDVAGARKAVARVDDPYVLLQIAEQRRFAPLWPALEAEGRFDWRAVTEAALKRRQAAAAAAPRTLADALEVQQLLRQLQRYDEAIALGQSLNKRILAGEKFADADRKANWVLNELAYVLGDVGRYAEAEAAFKASVATGENGGPSVSQAINWGEALLDLGRPKEALASVDSITDGASPYGEMWADAIRVCANATLNPAAARTLLDSMKAREDDNGAALTEALLCLDRQDEAAATYVRRLASDKRQEGAISAFRVVAPPPVLTARQKEMDRRKQAVLARPEVRKALDAVGRAVTLPLAGSYWGEI
jgi:tetratricopeptide (TPR) repeat protein